MGKKARFLFICLFFLISIAFPLLLMASSDGLTVTETVQVPCYVKVAVGGELRVLIHTDRKAALEIKTASDESVFTVAAYRNGGLREGSPTEEIILDRDEYRETWRFNKYFDQTPKTSMVDEVRVAVKKGAVYVDMAQTGEHRIDFYNYGYQRGTTVNSNLSLSVHITGDSFSGGQTSGNLILESETGEGQEIIPFTAEKDKTLTWEYAAEKGITDVDVDILKGQAKVILLQPSDYKSVSLERPKAREAEAARQPLKPVKETNAAKTEKNEEQPAETFETNTAGGTIFNGLVPLMDGARVTDEKSFGGTSRADFEVTATLEEVLSFYKQAMVAKGWTAGLSMVQGPMGMLQLSLDSSQIIMKVTGSGQTSTVNIALTAQ